MEKVVYILGAGFSAPLDLPVMSNFVRKSQDQFEQDEQKYKDFKDVQKAIRDMQIVNKYYDANLENIEDTLSILEFQATLSGKSSSNIKREKFLQYICDVIQHHTPPFIDNLGLSDVIGDSSQRQSKWSQYIMFVASLLGYTFIADGSTKGFKAIEDNSQRAEYSIISLNYDLVLEQCANYLAEFGFQRSFCKEIDQKSTTNIYLAKLHGSIDDPLNITPPTWNKGLTDNNLKSWKIAYKVLSEAHHIRIIGYSLPSTDTYIQYLLRAAVTEPTLANLKHIDVLCLDPDNSISEAYNNFLKFKSGFNFRAQFVENYFSNISATRVNNNEFRCDSLEVGHRRFFNW